MQKKSLIIAVLSIYLLLVMPFVSAGFFDFLKGKGFDFITGKSVEETIVKEQVKCVFLNSDLSQKCYGDNGVSCEGIGNCIAEVSGQQGAAITWKSSCGGYASTTIDGSNDAAEFKCEQIIAPAPAPTEEKTVISPSPSPTTPSSIIIKEQVKCVFANSNSEQKCYTGDGRFVCYGLSACTADVSGEQGKTLTWTSSCGGYASAVIDGNNDNIGFNCQQIQSPTSTPVPVPTPTPTTLKEQVKCVFVNSNSQQKCYSEGAGCSGIETCVVDVSGEKGKTLTWKSTCGSYAYTTIDGVNDYAKFRCEPAATAIEQPVPVQIPTEQKPIEPAPIPAGTPIENMKEQIIAKRAKLYFFWQSSCPHCALEMKFIEQLVQKYPQVGLQSIEISNPDNKEYFTNVVKSLGREPSGVPTTIIGDKIWVGYNDDIAKEIESSVRSCIAQGCLPGQPSPLIEPAAAKEQVECIFWNSDVLINPHTARPETCNSDDGKFGCKWTGNVVEKDMNGERVRYAHCIVEVSGASGTKLTWKSSCGGYADTVIDGNNEAAGFKCIPSSEVREEQITGKGFKRAYWQCYDSAEQKAVSTSVSCKTSEVWQREAQEFCKNHCYEDGSKCGVNSFSVSDECYPEFVEEETGLIEEAAPVFPIEEKYPIEEKEAIKEEAQKEEILICKDSCPLNGKCYPFGYRKEGKFCSDESMFREQLKEDTACENNFECSTNVCVDGKCMSSGLIQKVMKWFKGLF